MMLGNTGSERATGTAPAGEASFPAVAWAFTLSMAAIVIVSLLFAISPPALVVPIVPLDIVAARAGAVSAGPAIRWIAFFGMAADPVAAAAALALAWRSLHRDRGGQAIGWLLVGLSSLLFVIIDTTAGAVLVPLGRAAGESGFAGVKLLFDEMFVAGTVCLSLGQLCLTVPAIAAAQGQRATWLHWVLALDGLLGLMSAYGLLLGYNLALSLGISVGIAALLFTFAGGRMLAGDALLDL